MSQSPRVTFRRIALSGRLEDRHVAEEPARFWTSHRYCGEPYPKAELSTSRQTKNATRPHAMPRSHGIRAPAITRKTTVIEPSDTNISP